MKADSSRLRELLIALGRAIDEGRHPDDDEYAESLLIDAAKEAERITRLERAS